MHMNVSLNGQVQGKQRGIFKFLFVCSFFFFSELHLQHMEVPRLGVKWELQLWATTATATQDQSHICDLYHSSGQHQILNPLSEARD